MLWPHWPIICPLDMPNSPPTTGPLHLLSLCWECSSRRPSPGWCSGSVRALGPRHLPRGNHPNPHPAQVQHPPHTPAELPHGPSRYLASAQPRLPCSWLPGPTTHTPKRHRACFHTWKMEPTTAASCRGPGGGDQNNPETLGATVSAGGKPCGLWDLPPSVRPPVGASGNPRRGGR